MTTYDSRQESKTPRQVPALVRGLSILWTLAEQPMTAPEITRAVNLPRTTVHELLKTLELQRMVTSTDGRYMLGVKLFELGMAAGNSLDLTTISREITADIAAKVDETVQVAILDRMDVVYIAKAESSHAVQLVSHVGSRVPAHVTAVGKALLAFQDQPWIDAHIPAGSALSALTDYSITDADVLRSQLVDITKTGVAEEFCESNDDVQCVAAAVRDHTGAVVAGLSISVPVYRWSRAKSVQLRGAAIDGARRLSEALGHSVTLAAHPSAP